jgi:hypothetical protein
MENLRSSGIECEPRPGCGSRNGCAVWAVPVCCCPAARCPVGRVRCTSAGSSRRSVGFRRAPSRPDVPRRARKCPHLQLPEGVGADDRHRGTVVVAKPDRVTAAEECAAEECTLEPLVQLDLGADAHPPHYRRRWRGRRRAGRRGQPRSTSAAAAASHQRRRGGSTTVWSPHAGDPKTAPSCSGIDIAFPHQLWCAQHSSPNSGRVEPRSGAGCASGFRWGLRAVLRLAVRPRPSPGSAMRRFRTGRI